MGILALLEVIFSKELYPAAVCNYYLSKTSSQNSNISLKEESKESESFSQ